MDVLVFLCFSLIEFILSNFKPSLNLSMKVSALLFTSGLSQNFVLFLSAFSFLVDSPFVTSWDSSAVNGGCSPALFWNLTAMSFCAADSGGAGKSCFFSPIILEV
ncbi:hypothetical protein IC582_008152 [Cucumis melo]